jgi:hypothetical protein
MEDRKTTKVKFSPSALACLIGFFPRLKSDGIQDEPIWADAAKHNSPLTIPEYHLD